MKPVAESTHTIVPPARVKRLARGVNISRLFRYPAAPPAVHYPNFITESDLDLLRHMGVTCVRLTIGADQIMGPFRRQIPDSECLDNLTYAIDQMVGKGLAVVVSIYGLSKELDSKWRSSDYFVRFWAQLANALAGTDPEFVLFEPMNEPIFDRAPLVWLDLEQRLGVAIRFAAPSHTIVTSGTNWSSINGLLAREPMDDPNVVYSFHFYDPHPFTHQGAPWNNDWASKLRNVPYPLTPETVIDRFESASPRNLALIAYAAMRWDKDRIERRIRAVAEWRDRHGVPVWAGEFGSYPPYARRQDRLQWFADVRDALDRHGIGWAVWSYDEDLGLDRKQLPDGTITYDTDVARALRLAASTLA